MKLHRYETFSSLLRKIRLFFQARSSEGLAANVMGSLLFSWDLADTRNINSESLQFVCAELPTAFLEEKENANMQVLPKRFLHLVSGGYSAVESPSALPREVPSSVPTSLGASSQSSYSSFVLSVMRKMIVN